MVTVNIERLPDYEPQNTATNKFHEAAKLDGTGKNTELTFAEAGRYLYGDEPLNNEKAGRVAEFLSMADFLANPSSVYVYKEGKRVPAWLVEDKDGKTIMNLYMEDPSQSLDQLKSKVRQVAQAKVSICDWRRQIEPVPLLAFGGIFMGVSAILITLIPGGSLFLTIGMGAASVGFSSMSIKGRYYPPDIGAAIVCTPGVCNEGSHWSAIKDTYTGRW